jgi:hypothetical protein
MKTQSIKSTLNIIPFTLCLLLVFLLLTSLQCKKENLNVLPPATTTGENTMGAYIDGKLFVSRRLDLLSQDPGGTYNPTDPMLGFSGGSSFNPDGPNIGFSVKENLQLGKLNFETGGANYGLLTTRSVAGTLVHYYTESGFIEFTRVDIDKKVFSGRFDVIFKSETGQTIHVTDGRFDLKTK